MVAERKKVRLKMSLTILIEFKMEGFIDTNGVLHIMRGGVFKAQVCPFNGDRYCGDECPMFSSEVSNSLVSVCQKVLFFKNIEDRR